MIKVSLGKKRSYCSAELNKTGKDYWIKVVNKEGPHLGGIAVAEKGKKINSIKIKKHHELIVFEPMAKKLSKALKTKVIVFGGAHIEKPSKKELNELIKNLHDLTYELLFELKEPTESYIKKILKMEKEDFKKHGLKRMTNKELNKLFKIKKSRKKKKHR
ncbi:MAG: hypothetical protein ABIA76_00190 [Candidatus Diapherotrites archaeon]